jgi:hypothetical protein
MVAIVLPGEYRIAGTSGHEPDAVAVEVPVLVPVELLVVGQ